MKSERILTWCIILLGWLFVSSAFSAENPNKSKSFTWDNANVYFMLTDRFYDGNPANNQSYDRGKDPSGASYGTTNTSSGLYQNTGAFQGGDIVGVTKKITEGYFDKLGTNAIWISAPYEQAHGWVGGGPSQDFQHYAYHGYYTLDWTEMDANMGTKNEFKAFVDSAHAHGIRVVMDVVMNHAGYQTFNDAKEFGFGKYQTAGATWRPNAADASPWSGFNALWSYDTGNGWENWWGADWVRSPDIKGYDTCSPGAGLTNCVGYLPDFKTETTNAVTLPKILINKWAKEGTLAAKTAQMDAWFTKTGYPKTVSNYLIQWLSQWVKDYGIDGFRVDTAKHVDLATWKKLLDECRASLKEWKNANPTKKLDDNEFWATAEVFGHQFAQSEYHTVATFNSVINFGLQGDTRMTTPTSYDGLFAQYAGVNPNKGWNGLSYVSSHDTKLHDRSTLKNIAPSFLMLPGGIQTFYGDESARPLGSCADAEQQTRSFMNWSAPDNTTLNLWRKFGTFRRDHSAVGAGIHKQLKSSPYTFSRTYDNATLRITDAVVCVYGATGPTTVDVSSVFANGDVVRDWPTGTKATVSAGQVTLTPDADGYLLIGLDMAKPYVDRPVVTVTPDGGYSKDPIPVTITANDFSDANPTIYYTTNAALTTSDLSQWTKYTAPFNITSTAEIRAISKNANGYLSDIVTKSFAVGALPTIRIFVKKATTWTAPCKIHYFDVLPAGVLSSSVWASRPVMTADGGDWYEYTFSALSVSMVFTDNGTNQIPGSTEPAFTRTKTGWFDANTKIWTDIAPAGAPNGLSPNISPASGNFPSGSVTVTLSAPQGGDIYYTTDGSTPTTSSSLYSTPFNITGPNGATKTINSIAVSGGITSSASVANYTFNQVSTITIFFRGKTHVYGYTAAGVKNPAWANWPGYTNTPTATGWYQQTFECTSLNVIFNNNGATQTANFLRSANSWWDNGVWYDKAPADAPTSLFNPKTQLEGDAPYPNPFSSEVKFKLGVENSEVDVKLFNLTGMVVFSAELFTTDGTITILPEVPNGIYILQASTEAGSYRYKVIKK